ncbi:polysaccharide biosynthesis/export family protein [candidate division KSB1 bacterium]|nr:polysaccharide biosynthesis/export family protein [candidate division KSB1 bacterium]
MLQIKYIIYSIIALLFTGLDLFAADDFKFKKADGLRILIYDNDMEPERNRILASFHDTEFVIDGEGYVHLGSFGRVYVANLSVEEVTKLFEEKLRTYGKNLTIMVVPLIRLILRGEFGKPGMYRFSPRTSFWDLVAEAGGMSSNLAAENIYVVRRGEIIYAEFWNSLNEGASIGELGLESGDEIVVPRINRISFDAVMRYINLFASLFFLYYALTDEKRR